MSTVISREWRSENGALFEYVREVVGVTTCAKCGKEVQLVGETMEWEEGDRPGVWKATGDGGLATGECCGLLYADWWEGCFVYDLDAVPETGARRCRVCGCTDLDCSGCVERTGEACSWVPEHDDNPDGPICSACVEPEDYDP